jgi:hypothetical protein
MVKSSPIQDPGFKRTLRNLLTAPPKRQADMKVGKAKAKKARGLVPKGRK